MAKAKKQPAEEVQEEVVTDEATAPVEQGPLPYELELLAQYAKDREGQ